MSITDRSRERVDALLRDLEREYGAFEVVEKAWTHPPAEYRSLVERFEESAVGGAGVWVRNDDGDLLLVRNEGDDGWGDPGGKREAGESFETAAKREVREEAGVECRLTGLHEVHVVENRNDDAPAAPVVYDAIVVFRGEHVDGEPRPRDGEIAEVSWFASPPDEVLYEEVRDGPFPADGGGPDSE